MSPPDLELEFDRLQECEERSKLVKLATDDTIWDWNLETNLVERSARASKFGYDDWKTNNSISWWENHIHPDDRVATLAAFAAAISGNQTSISVEYRFCKADGDTAYIYDRAFIIRNDSGTGVRAIGAMIDLTELRLVKLLLRKTENRLAYSSRLNAMGTMGSMLAHELNQPLTAAANYIRASRHIFASANSTDFDKVHEALEGAERNTLRAGEVIRKLRDLVTRREISGAEQLLSQLIEDGCSIGVSEANPADVAISITVTPPNLAVWADRIQVQQVIVNLVRNSVEAMENCSDPKITIDAIKTENFAQISICDNGSGIADDIRDGIFSAVLTTKAEGMGIGLSICRTIIEAQGGQIWLASSNSNGTDFKFTLPLLPRAQDQSQI